MHSFPLARFHLPAHFERIGCGKKALDTLAGVSCLPPLLLPLHKAPVPHR